MEDCVARHRTQDALNTLCELIICVRCGAAAAHRVCAGMNILASEYYCISCKSAQNPLEDNFNLETALEDCSKESCLAVICKNKNGRCASDET